MKKTALKSPSRLTFIIILIIAVLALLWFLKPLPHAPTQEAALDKNVQNGTVQQIQKATIEVKQADK